MSQKPTFHIRVINAEKTLLDVQAFSISAMNRKGKFDVLPNHSPFICVLSNGDLIIRREDKKIEQINIQRGILKFVNNEAVVLTGL